MNIRWLGHSSFLITSEDTSMLVDPFLTGSPTAPEGIIAELDDVDIILLTHGHQDHMGDALDILKKNKATLISSFEICHWMIAKGVSEENCLDMNIGGAVECKGITANMVQAVHSNSILDDGKIIYGGGPSGFVINVSGTAIYHPGDTGVFLDMKLIQELYSPSIGLIPIGGRFTMCPRTAAYACNELLSLETIIPMHYDTFPLLTGKPEEFKELVRRGKVEILKPGESFSI
jgi:L-ascorbate metabolism protein UlaG (beta-lactamase superfamily)